MLSLSSSLPSSRTCIIYSALTVVTLGAIALTIIGSLDLKSQYSPSSLGMVTGGGTVLAIEALIFAVVKWRNRRITGEEAENLKKNLHPGEYFKYGHDRYFVMINYRAAEAERFKKESNFQNPGSQISFGFDHSEEYEGIRTNYVEIGKSKLLSRS